MTDPLEVKKRKCDYFIPRKQSHSDVRISDHAVAQYTKRFGNGNGSVRGIIKSVIDNGEVVLYKDERNQVIRKGGVYAIVNDAMVRTVYTDKIFDGAKERILKSWNGEEVDR